MTYTSLKYLDAAVALGYLLTTLFYLVVFIGGRKQLHRFAASLLLTILTVHSFLLLQKALLLGHLSVVGVFEAISFVAWSIALIFLLLQWRLEAFSLGIFLLPFVTAMQATAYLMTRHLSEPLTLPLHLQSPLFGLHVGSALFSYSSFSIASAAGLTYVLLSGELRLKRVGFFFNRMPPLQRLHQINVYAVGIGVGLLAMGILAGFLWFDAIQLSPWEDAPKMVTALLIWALYAVNWLLSVWGGWLGKRAALFSVVNFCLLFGCYFVVNLLFAQLHRSV